MKSGQLPTQNCTSFDLSPITPGLVKNVLKKRSSNSSPGDDGITYHHLKKVPSCHHFLSTLFSKILLQSRSAPSVWCKAKIKLLFKGVDPKLPENVCPIALISTIGKLFHKILAIRLENFLGMNDLIDSSVQKRFMKGVNGTFEHIFSVSAILDNALHHKLPLPMTFIDLKNAFGSVSRRYIDDILNTSVFQWRITLTYLVYILCYLVSLQSKSGRPIPSQSAVVSFRVILCPLSFSWWLLTPSSNLFRVGHCQDSVYTFLLLLPPMIYQKKILLYAYFGMNLNQMNLQGGI